MSSDVSYFLRKPLRSFEVRLPLNKLQKRFNLVIRDIFLFGFIVNRDQEDGIIGHVKMGNNPCSTGFSFAF
ncbi:hypothetical protein DES35_1145 [Schleiferia thermophila]|uniref:Uncharacterized protein n=1 Tax=Schleiferia thermophila TaxID=884107 RepID=A0A368ZUM0_9FLAO|nr:hypothetical protein DES35_1145 [Schleiferia thermophila]